MLGVAGVFGSATAIAVFFNGPQESLYFFQNPRFRAPQRYFEVAFTPAVKPRKSAITFLWAASDVVRQ
jgi:hypothetical protein